jgi:hypothetical protein
MPSALAVNAVGRDRSGGRSMGVASDVELMPLDRRTADTRCDRRRLVDRRASVPTG